MARGRPRKPAEIKLAQGTLRKDREGDNALAIEREVRPAPESLGDHGTAAWNEYAPLAVKARVVKESDWRALEAMCRAYDEVAQLDEILTTHGQFYANPNGTWCRHPAVDTRFKWLDTIRKYQLDFGFTPASRGSVKASEPAAKGIKARSR